MSPGVFAVALALVLCGGPPALADGNRIPGVYDPATKSFRLYPIARAPAAVSAKIYKGTLKVTAKLLLSVPAGTTVSVYVSASVADFAGGFSNFAQGQVTASGKAATLDFTIPYAASLSDPSDKVTVYLNVNAPYTNKDDVSFSPSGVGSTTIPLPKDGAVTKVIVTAGV